MNFDQSETINFDQLYEQYYTPIYKKIFYLIGDRLVAEDLAQETFMKLYKAPPQHSNIKGWLYQVATHLAYNHVRNITKRKSKIALLFQKEILKTPSSEEAALLKTEINFTREILDELPPRDRIILLLKFSGYKYHEIAELLGINKNSIGTILSRAQAKFKKSYLAKKGGF